MSSGRVRRSEILKSFARTSWREKWEKACYERDKPELKALCEKLANFGEIFPARELVEASLLKWKENQFENGHWRLGSHVTTCPLCAAHFHMRVRVVKDDRTCVTCPLYAAQANRPCSDPLSACAPTAWELSREGDKEPLIEILKRVLLVVQDNPSYSPSVEILENTLLKEEIRTLFARSEQYRSEHGWGIREAWREKWAKACTTQKICELEALCECLPAWKEVFSACDLVEASLLKWRTNVKDVRSNDEIHWSLGAHVTTCPLCAVYAHDRTCAECPLCVAQDNHRCSTIGQVTPWVKVLEGDKAPLIMALEKALVEAAAMDRAAKQSMGQSG